VTGLKVSQRGLTGPPRAFETCGKKVFHSFCPPLRFTDTCGKLFFHNLTVYPRHFENWLEALDKSRNPCYYEFKKTEKSRKTRNLKILKNTKS
jgi:hypothetical protein